MNIQKAPTTQPVAVAGRDLRLDLFRGIALWLIFLDHIPSNPVSWITIRNYGFSDATEIFVFISGYTAAFVYGRALRDRGFLIACAKVLRRAWQVYVAHIFLFVVFMAQIAYVASSFENPLYAEEMNILDFFKQPDTMLVQALLLKFKPANMDVLPLYIMLLIGFPPLLWLLLRWPLVALAGAAALYALAWEFGLNFPAYPSGEWAFNPFAWQLLFVFGAWCALDGAERLSALLFSRITIVLAAAYLLFALAIVMTWHVPRWGQYVPKWLSDWIYPIDKANLDVLRFLHFLALSVLVVNLVPPGWKGLNSFLARLAVVCGQHSLEIFCLGVFLAFGGHFILVEYSFGLIMHIVISVLGIFIMVAVAGMLSWYKSFEERGPGRKKPEPDADLAGGDA